MSRLTFLAISSVALISAIGCNVQNSFSGDRRFQQVGPMPTGFAAVQGILQNRCAECHDYAFTEAKWKASPDLVKPGDPDCSPLYFRLNGGGAKCASLQLDQDMPKEKLALPASELTVLHDWIQGLGRASKASDQIE